VLNAICATASVDFADSSTLLQTVPPVGMHDDRIMQPWQAIISLFACLSYQYGTVLRLEWSYHSLLTAKETSLPETTACRVGGKNSNKPPKRSLKSRACLYDCDGGFTAASLMLAHVAGSPWEYSSDNASQTFSGKRLVSAVEDQGSCGTCVNYALISTIQSTVAGESLHR